MKTGKGASARPRLSDPIKGYVDGSAAVSPEGKQELGGWGGIIEWPDGTTKTIGGRIEGTDNNRMKVYAAERLLRRLPPGSEVMIQTDSQLVAQALEGWLEELERRGWLDRSGEPKENADVLRKLKRAMKGHEIEVDLVRSGYGHEYHKQADRIARGFARKLRERRRRERAERPSVALSVKKPGTKLDG